MLGLATSGTGVKLTVRDDVLHLDPSRDPAVEHQASDRAQLIGQRRPVTIDRLVTEATVSDKVLAARPQAELADDLLAGFERGEAPDMAGLPALLRG